MKTIKRIVKIKNCPSFVDCKPSSDLPDFKRFNLVYGWNGSGKTSFSRVLRSFELQENYHNNPDKPSEFELLLNSGSSITHSDLSTLPNIRVFNRDFVEDSVFGTDGPKPIFFLGKESKEDKEKIINLTTETQKLTTEKETKKLLLDKAKNNKDRMLSEKARDIKNALTTSRMDKYRNYERPNLETTLSSNSEELMDPSSHLLEKVKLAGIQKVIQQSSKPKLEAIPVPEFDISEVAGEADQLLKQTVTSQVIESLRDDGQVSKWVEHGLAIHKQKSLEKCAFCSQPIPQHRISELENHFNDEYQNLLAKLGNLKQRLANKRITIEFQDASNLYEDLSSQYLDKQKIAQKNIADFNKYIDSIISTIEKKEQNPFSSFELKHQLQLKPDSIVDVNEIIKNHNKKTENFESQIDENKNILEMHYVAEFIESYKEVLGEIKSLDSDYSKLAESVGQKEAEVEKLKKRLISHHIPADQINRDLEHFLGRSDIQLKATDEQEGYQIFRNGEIALNLSEGEKTALAIVYFLTKINEEGFDMDQGIIVVDDPVSSLDSGSIFQAFGFIKESIKGAGQVFILTHHFDFFRQVKNWFSKCKKTDREYFMITCKKEGTVRNSSISEIDKLLINYESEYHFLFSILYRFTQNEEKELEKLYPLPNIARKFLESFLAFRVPIGSSVSNIYERLSHLEFDSKKKERIRRFVETHSHPRYESGVQDFDMTILGETTEILNDLLELVETEDKKHYDFLVKSVTD